MLHDIVTKGSTDRSVTFRAVDASGAPVTDLVYDSAGIDMWYRREGAAKTSITEASLSALTDSHTDGGILHIDDGYYRLDLPDAAFASGANSVDFGGSATDVVIIGGRVRLIGINLEDAVRGGLTALPNANAEAAGGLYTRGSGAGQIAQDANGRVNVNVAAIETADPSDTIRDAVVDDATRIDASALNTLSSHDPGEAIMGATDLGTGSGLTSLASASALTSLSGIFTGITSLAQWLGLIAGKQTGNSTARTELRATGAGSGSYDETTDSLEAVRDHQQTAAAAALTSYDPPTNAEMEARTLAAASYATASALATVDSVVDAIKVTTDKLDTTLESDGGSGYQYTETALENGPAGEGGGGATAEEIADAVWDEALSEHTTEGSAGYILGNVATGTPPSADAIADEVQTRTIAAVTLVNGIAANAVTASALAADAVSEIQSGLATSSALSALDAKVGAPAVSVAADIADVEGKVDDLETRLTATRAGYLDNLSAGPVAQASALATVDGIVDAILALVDDPRSEPGQGAPPASADLVTKVDYLYKLARNKVEQTATEMRVYADNGTTVDHRADVSDDGDVYTRGELGTGA